MTILKRFKAVGHWLTGNEADFEKVVVEIALARLKKYTDRNLPDISRSIFLIDSVAGRHRFFELSAIGYDRLSIRPRTLSDASKDALKSAIVEIALNKPKNVRCDITFGEFAEVLHIYVEMEKRVASRDRPKTIPSITPIAGQPMLLTAHC